MTPFEIVIAQVQPLFYYKLEAGTSLAEFAFWKHHFIATRDHTTVIIGPLVNTKVSNFRKIAESMDSVGFFMSMLEGPCVRTVDLGHPDGLEHLQAQVKECVMISKIRPATAQGNSTTSATSSGRPSVRRT